MIKNSKILLLFILLLISSCGNSADENSSLSFSSDIVEITEDIDSPTTWYADKVYVIKSRSETIGVYAALTIEAGSIIKFNDGSKLRVETNGVINANGSEANPVIFTSIKDDAHGGDTNGDGGVTLPARRDWDGIQLGNSGSQFNYCKLYYTGGSAIEIRQVSATITNNTFAHNDGGNLSFIDGVVNAEDAYPGTVITGNIFYDNNIPLYLDSNISIDDTNIFHDPSDETQTNTYNGIFIKSNYMTGDVTWGETEVPFVITGDVQDILEGAVLTIQDSVVVKFYEGAKIDSRGMISANATDDNSRIIFTSIKDDAHGGDTNGDDDLTIPARSDWDQIILRGNSSVFNNCEFYYGMDTLDLNSNSAVVTNNVFAFNNGGSLSWPKGVVNAETAPSTTIVAGNVFYGNNVPLKISDEMSIGDSNIFHNPNDPNEMNTYNGIFLPDTFSMSEAISWLETEVPFVMSDSISIIQTEGSLTIGDNVIIKFMRGVKLSLKGGNNIKNKSGAGVWFTSIKDDLRGGDTNGDGNTIPDNSDYWEGIYYSVSDTWESSSNVLYDSH